MSASGFRVRRNRLEEQWAYFERKVAASMGTEQLRDVRRGFYAGGVAVLAVMGDTAAEEGLDAQDWVSVVRDLRQEMVEFRELVRQGKA